MKELLKDYGSLIGPLIAFTFGVLAIYIKFYTDRQTARWQSDKKMKKLVSLIASSPPPATYFPQQSTIGFMHADQARNISNHSRFYTRILVVKSYISAVENDILTNCFVSRVQQFNLIKITIDRLITDIEKTRKQLNEHKAWGAYTDVEYHEIVHEYEHLSEICHNPSQFFTYIE